MVNGIIIIEPRGLNVGLRVDVKHLKDDKWNIGRNVVNIITMNRKTIARKLYVIKITNLLHRNSDELNKFHFYKVSPL